MLHIVLLKHFNLLDPPWNGSILRVEGALGGNTATVQYHRIPTVHPFPFPDVKVQVHEESWRYEDISYLIHRMHTVMWLTCTSGMSSARDVPGKGPKGKAFGSSVLGAHHRLVGKWAGWWPLPPEIQFSEKNRTYRIISNQADVTRICCERLLSAELCRVWNLFAESWFVAFVAVSFLLYRFLHVLACTTRPTSIVPWAHLDPVKGNIQPLSFPSSHGYHMLSPKPPPKPRRSVECWRMVHPGRAARALQKDPLQLQRRSRELILFDSLLSPGLFETAQKHVALDVILSYFSIF